VGPHSGWWPERWSRLLGVDFDGAESDPDAVVAAGLDDPRHIDRVPSLTALAQEAQAAPIERLHAAVALATWGESAGYRAVVDAAREPWRAPWYGWSIDRKFSVDNTSSWFATAILSSERTARAKDTVEERLAALRALVGIADREYFDEQLEWAVGSGPVDRVATDIEDVVQRGVRRLLDGDAPAFDLATQLVDLTAALVESDDAAAVHLAAEVITAVPNRRALLHAAELVARGAGARSLELADHLGSIGDGEVRRSVARALELRRSQPDSGSG
jgi:hypothetical protein